MKNVTKSEQLMNKSFGKKSNLHNSIMLLKMKLKSKSLTFGGLMVNKSIKIIALLFKMLINVMEPEKLNIKYIVYIQYITHL